MTSARQRRANRANARASTGPRTAAGKASAARNAFRHGLSMSILADPEHAAAVAVLVREIVGEGANPDLHEYASRIAEAQIDLVRVRRARHELFSRALTGRDYESPTDGGPDKQVRILVDLAKRQAVMDRYERRTLSRRKLAIRAFDAARVALAKAVDNS